MSFSIAGFLSKELTCIPEVLSKYFGRFYSNALCNGCTWLFILWYVLHSGLDYALNELFRKMRYREYIRTRLKYSLWYLGFYCTAFVYTGATLFQNKVDVLRFRKLLASTYTDVSSDLVIGFMVLFTFFLHSAFWEVMQYDSKSNFLSYILLCLVLLVSFFLRILEVAFTLTAFISITQVSIESAKLLYIVTKQDSVYLRNAVLVFFGLSICSFALSYLIGVPLIFLIPCSRKIISAHLSLGYLILTILLASWYISGINNSPLFKLVNHWLFHTPKTTECCGHLVECSLFPPRNDLAYNLLQLRKEIKEREERMQALRKQSRKGMLMQTIKCMVNLKRKIHAKRATVKRSPDKDSEESSDSCECPKEEAGERQKLINKSEVNGPVEVETIVGDEVTNLMNAVGEKIGNTEQAESGKSYEIVRDNEDYCNDEIQKITENIKEQNEKIAQEERSYEATPEVDPVTTSDIDPNMQEHEDTECLGNGPNGCCNYVD